MKVVAVCFALVMSLALATAQHFGSPLPTFGLSSLTGDFGGPTAFGGQDFSAGAGRDPRQNRGPVVFPPPPTDGPMETSGVVVGASGYGFVPPNTPQKYRKKFLQHRPQSGHWKPVSAYHVGQARKPPHLVGHGGVKKPLRHPPYKLSRPVALQEASRPKRTKQSQLVAAFTIPGDMG